MSIVGAFGVHGRQLTFEYLDTDIETLQNIGAPLQPVDDLCQPCGVSPGGGPVTYPLARLGRRTQNRRGLQAAYQPR